MPDSPEAAIKAAAAAVKAEQGGTGEDFKCGDVQNDSGWNNGQAKSE